MTAATGFLVGAAIPAFAAVIMLVAEPSPDPRIASTDVAEVCATDGLPGSAYSRAHRVAKRAATPGRIKDHIVPLCLGGADVDANIQLQTSEEAEFKDGLERLACSAVCKGGYSLTDAQGWFIHKYEEGFWR